MLARPYEITDRTACLGIFDSNAPDYVRPEERIQFEQFLDRLPGPYLVVMDDDQLVACGGFATGRVVGEADIRWTLVHRDHHGHGVGDFLMTTCVIEILALEHIHTARLETSHRTQTFFERWGFTSVEVVPSGLGPGLDQVEMRSALTNGGRAHWLEMISGGLTPPIVEEPIPAIEQYKEWADHRYAPGHYLGGTPPPHLDVTLGPGGRRRSGLLIGMLAILTTAGAITSWSDGNPLERVVSLVFSAILWVGAFRLLSSGAREMDNR
jgi:N-acetylglutamate synthase-like GNAT family acetyltransferase